MPPEDAVMKAAYLRQKKIVNISEGEFKCKSLRSRKSAA